MLFRSKEQETDLDDWYLITLNQLVKVCQNVSSKYTRSKVRKALPAEFSYIIQELLHLSLIHICLFHRQLCHRRFRHCQHRIENGDGALHNVAYHSGRRDCGYCLESVHLVEGNPFLFFAHAYRRFCRSCHHGTRF